MNFDIHVLGTSAGQPTRDRTVSGILIARGGDRILIDPGEGTQHQLLAHDLGLATSTVCLTHMHADHTLGLAGLLQTWQFQGREQPLTVVVPAAGTDTLAALQTVVGGALPFATEVKPVTAQSVAVNGDDYTLRALPATHPGPAVGYGLFEDARQGRFQRDVAERLGVPPGPAFGRLQRGDTVTLSDDTIVTPEQVMGPPRRGRRFIYTGDTRPVLDATMVPTPVDLLVHEATFLGRQQERATRTGHSTAAEAGRVAAALDAETLVLTHLSPRYESTDGFVSEATAATDATIKIATDGLQQSIPYLD